MLARLPLVHRTILAIRMPSGNAQDFLLAVGDPKIKNEEAVARIIEQSSSKAFHPEVIFDVKGTTTFRRQNILETIDVRLRDDGNRYIIPLEEYKRISNDMSNPGSESVDSDDHYGIFNPDRRDSNLQDEQNSQDSLQQDYEDEQQANPTQTMEVVRKRGRPKGSKNKKKLGQMSESDKEDQFEEFQKRGRGRPKGSKNKKNLMKKEHAVGEPNNKDTFELRVLMSGYLKRGKGRPKGSKNKPKLKQQFVQNPVKEETMFGKRGKGRPKGSKNKIKNHEKMIEKGQRLGMFKEQQKEKRQRGRPKGVRNRPKSQPSIDQASQDEETVAGIISQIPSLKDFEKIYCCRRCQNRKSKELFLQAIHSDSWQQAIAERDFSTLTNVNDYLGPDRRQNLFLSAIKRNSTFLLNNLLQLQNKKQYYFKCCWQIDGRIELNKYDTQTSKEFLTKSGKEGIYSLLHDCYTPKETQWWRILSVERIIESMSNQTTEEIVKILLNYSEELQKQLISHIPSLIRCGNHHTARLLLHHTFNKNNPHQFSNEHLECLEPSTQLQVKKMNIFRKSLGANYCSPIHCAAINSNPEVLQLLVKTFQNFNISDSLGRKPIHYAATCQNVYNLEVLVKTESDLQELDKQNMTPLMLACYHGRNSCVQFILDRITKDLYVNFSSSEGYAALHYAVLNEHQECVKAMLDYPTVDINVETKDKQTPLHLAAATNNLSILNLLLTHGAHPDYYDKCRRTPLMIAIRNNSNDVLRQLIYSPVKIFKCDSSMNSLLHYAAAYGNYPAVKCFISLLKQAKNKANMYPWQVAVTKGHIGCAKLLDKEDTVDEGVFYFQNNTLIHLLKNISSPTETIEIVKYLLDSGRFPINSQEYNGYTALHYCCSISQEDYIKGRQRDVPHLEHQELKEEYRWLQEQIINQLKKAGINTNLQNKNKQTAFEMCAENGNLIGMRLLMPDKIDLDFQTSNGSTLMYFLIGMACLSVEECRFALQQFKNFEPGKLKESLKKQDMAGCDPLLHLIKDWTNNIKSNFREKVARGNTQRQEIVAISSPVKKGKGNGMVQSYNHENISTVRQTFNILQEHQQLLLKILTIFCEVGCSFNTTMHDKTSNKEPVPQKKWNIYHYVMRFPSIRLLEFLKNKVKDINAKDQDGRTPLHYFCMWNHKGSLLHPELEAQKDYNGQTSLRYLLEHGSNHKLVDNFGSTPLLYSALNKQITFMAILGQFGSPFNICNKKNQVPLVEVIRQKQYYKIEEIKQLLKNGADPNFQDLEGRNCLHHLVYHATNFDSSAEICKTLFQHGVKINSLDKYQRTPLFYCFTDMQNLQKHKQNSQPSDKVQILQALLCHPDIKINHVDYRLRSALHYACQRDFFFSIMYLLDKGVDTQLEDKDGNTPLAICLLRRNLDQAALLLKKGVKDGSVINGSTAQSYFEYAFKNLSVAVCFMLLDHGYPLTKAMEIVKQGNAFRKVLMKKYGNRRG